MNFHAWVLRKLGEVVNITMGQSPSSVNYTDDSSYDVLVQGNADLKNGWVIPRVWTKQVTKKGKRGDIILSVRAPVGEVAKTSFDVVLGRGVASVTGNEFVYQALLRLKTNGYWRRLSTGSTFESINSNDIKNANLFFTEKNEQQAIGSLFKKIDNLIVLQQRKIDTLKLLKKALLQQIIPENNHIIPRIRPIHFKEPWNQDKINNIFKVTRGQVLSATLVSEVKTDIKKYPVYSSQTKNNGLLGYFDKFLFEDAITWTTDGANAGTVNFRKGKFYSTNVNGVLISKDKYANQLIAEIINRIAWKYVSKVGNPKLMNNVMSDIKICVPLNYDEQNIMSLLLQNLDDFLNLNNQKIIQIKTVKKSLLQKMFM
ncbi:restriction endonuclease subunit S [Pediococcus sp. EKM202D]|jgi:type I restriction enzyme S subunit|uniref:restriction endonuclease subunit S n=1 Tax=unclassified Pediococcus TaxID=554805 RepID=UPI00142D7EBB|nr:MULTISPECIES: restriction endonuclease subunit S [unclassified Pediococcus]KAF5438412.1 restriction endonuclease subunit S [Pediococcus sp. EKM202D]